MSDTKRILLIDDEPDFVDMIKMRLESNDYEVIAADNGEDGIRLAQAEKPDLILLDVMMPGIDGFQTLQRLKADGKTWDIPVVMLTAKREMKSIQRAQDISAADYLIKPCESKDLMAVVRRYA